MGPAPMATNVLRRHVLSLDLKQVKLSAVPTDEGRVFLTVRAQHENRRAAMFVDESLLTVGLTYR